MGSAPPLVGERAVRYRAEVVAVGPMVADLRSQDVLVLFAEGAPEELHEFCVLTRPQVVDAGPQVGGTVVIDDVEMPILAVGDVVEENLMNLGHLDLKADGATTASLPGDVCVPRGSLPEVSQGSLFTVLGAAEVLR